MASPGWLTPDSPRVDRAAEHAERRRHAGLVLQAARQVGRLRGVGDRGLRGRIPADDHVAVLLAHAGLVLEPQTGIDRELAEAPRVLRERAVQ